MEQTILLAGGSGKRVKKISAFLSKHLIPLYNEKVVIDYSINSAIKLGTKQLIIVLGAAHCGQIIDYIRSGSSLGLEVVYFFQEEALGIAHGVNLCRSIIDGNFGLILADNIFQHTLPWKTSDLTKNNPNAARIALDKENKDLQHFGVASINKTGKIIRI